MYALYLRRDELAHYGVQGQKWGTRRYQDESGALTEEGRLHYGVGAPRQKGESYSSAVKRLRADYDKLNANNSSKMSSKEYKAQREKFVADSYGPTYKKDVIAAKQDQTRRAIAIGAGATIAAVAVIGGVYIATDAKKEVTQKSYILNRSVNNVLQKMGPDHTETSSDVEIADGLIKKGQELYRKTGNKGEDITNSKTAFVSDNKTDRAIYGGMMGVAVKDGSVRGYHRSSKMSDGYNTTYRAKTDIKVAGKEAQAKALEKAGNYLAYKENAKKYTDKDLINNAKASGMTVSQYKKAIYDMGKGSSLSKAEWNNYTKTYNYHLVNPDKLDKDSANVLNTWKRALAVSGYGAVRDLNDSGLFTKTPNVLLKTSNVEKVSEHKRTTLDSVKDIWSMPADLGEYFKK